MLGADEYGFSTAPLIASGCIMMRACHLNTCPVGIATQDPELRKRFEGQPEHVVNYFFFVAEEARKIMAGLGVGTMDELIGRSELIEADDAVEHWKARGIDLSGVLAFPEGVPEDAPRRRIRPQEPVLEDNLDWKLIERAGDSIETGEPVEFDMDVRNVDRCVGGIMSNAIAVRRGAVGLAEDTIKVNFRGSAGQSFGGWLAPGVSFSLRGEVNDYVGKGLSGGILAVSPPEGAAYEASENVIVGNTALYGATGGRAFFRGVGGERFAVRNSGAEAVIEGVGDHGCEYMTGGTVVVLGPTGRNFAAGMSGGLAYVYDPDSEFEARINPTMVSQIEELEDTDRYELRRLVSEHGRRTGSDIAARILDRWEEEAGRFVKVFPTDYKRVLAELEADATGAGLAGAPADGSPQPVATSRKGG
jgi:glutamate synthase (NADPH/NADH) large chain/glutamate synthase (ferredoxin)